MDTEEGLGYIGVFKKINSNVDSETFSRQQAEELCDVSYRSMSNHLKRLTKIGWLTVEIETTNTFPMKKMIKYKINYGKILDTLLEGDD